MNRTLTHISHRAMACEFVIYLPEHVKSSAIEAAVAALDTLQSIESRLTVYDPESEISRVNRFAGQPVRVSHATAELVLKALQWSRRTDGAFDVTAGPLIDAWGFTNRQGQKPSPQQLAEAKRHVGFSLLDVQLDPPTITLKKPGMKINLGAIGKGDAMDRVANQLLADGVEHFLLHAGASSIVARGHENLDCVDSLPSVPESPSRGLEKIERPDPSGPGWRIGIAHPTVARRTLGHVQLINQALATSGSGRQFFHHRGQRYGHVLDPRTGQPAGDSLSISVVTANATDADAAATAMFVMSDRSRQSLGLPMLKVSAGSRQNEVHISASPSLAWQPIQPTTDPSDKPDERGPTT